MSVDYIPKTSQVYNTLFQQTDTRIIVFSGLPGVGKSLYINAFKSIAESQGKDIDMIQWDVARKAFETDFIQQHYPMGAGIVHNGLKLIAGQWLMETVKNWIDFQKKSSNILLIEAPLVGNRFVEIMQKQKDSNLEDFLSDTTCRVIVPIPSKVVREKIEEERKRQVSEEVKVWSGAKPSVMLMLWKMTCEIANEFGKNIDVSGQPAYDPEIYEFVYSKILKHRQFIPLHIDEIFEIPEVDESQLHNTNSMHATPEIANQFGEKIINHFNDYQIDEIVNSWYHT